MIHANELRIGNYVLINGTCLQVNSIDGGKGLDGTSIICYLPGGVESKKDCGSDTVLPVLITDEILACCGFVYHDYFKCWQKKVDGKGTEMDINRDYDVVDFLRKPLVKNVRSLHQLQNIFFALKGKELNFFQPIARVTQNVN